MTSVGVAATVAATVLLATPAWAHVTVHPETLPAGSSDIELTFRVPNERGDANTVGLQVFFPTDLPLLTVDVLPVPGWTAKVDTRNLATPITTDDGTVSQVVSDVTWTATAGGTAPGQYEDFVVAAGRGPGRPGSAIFKSLQVYSSGEVVRWIQVTSSQDPNPDNPAPDRHAGSHVRCRGGHHYGQFDVGGGTGRCGTGRLARRSRRDGRPGGAQTGAVRECRVERRR
jgi:uncharacterized protein YcnI